MSWYDNWTDFGHLVGDPAGYATGINKNGVTGIKDFLSGNPDKVKAAYDQAISQSQNNGQQIRDFLLGREQQAQKFYQPLQALFSSAYGTQGIQGPQVPPAGK